MVQILERPETFSSLLAKQLGGGLGKGISEGSQMVMQLRGQQAKEREKGRSRLFSEAPKYLKTFHPSYTTNPEKYHSVIDKASKYVDQGLHAQEALSLAVQDLKGTDANKFAEEIGSSSISDLKKMSDPNASFLDKVKALGTGALSGIDWLSKHGTGLIPQVEGLRRKQMEEAGIPEISPSEYIAEQLKEEARQPKEQAPHCRAGGSHPN